MRIHLGLADLLLVALYFVATLWIGLRAARGAGERSAEDFLLLGRRMTLPLFVGSLVATWYGGLIGVGEIAYRDGLVTWLTQGGFWYLSYLIFAGALAGRLAETGAATLPDQVGLMHGPTARLLALALNFINVVPIAYLLSLGLLLHLATGWPIPLAIVAGTSVAVAYSLLGGFRAVVYTDLLQFGLMCLAVGLLMIACVVVLGGADYLEARLPATHLQPAGAMTTQELVVWAMIALSTLVDPNFYHRCFAAGSARTARRGILIAVGFWLLFDVCSTFSGLYARAALPGIDPKLAFPLLADLVLPPGLRGLFFVGLLATVMSTIDSYCFVGAMTLAHDVYRKTFAPAASDAAVTRATRAGVLATAGVAMALSMVFSGSIKAIWKLLGSLSSASMLVPILIGLAGWRPPGAGAASILGGATGTLGWAALRALVGGRTLTLEPIVPGICISLGCYLVWGALASGGAGAPDREDR